MADLAYQDRTIGPQGAGEGAGAARSTDTRSGHEFARARRHSGLVRLLRIGLPVVAVLMVLVGVAAAWVARSLPGDLSFAASSIEDGRLVMQNPRLTGADSSDRPYAMTARRAIQSATGSGVDLEGVRADVAVDAQTNAVIDAGNGHYDIETERLSLFDDIAIDTTSGIAIRLTQAEIDMGAGLLVGQGPVTITTPGQRLESGSVRVENGGTNLSFGDRVKLTLLPNAAGEASSE